MGTPFRLTTSIIVLGLLAACAVPPPPPTPAVIARPTSTIQAVVSTAIAATSTAKPIVTLTPTPALSLEEAQAGWKTIEDEFALAGQPGFFKDSPGDQTPAAMWSHSQGIAAALDIAELTGNYDTARAMLATLGAYQCGGGYTPYPHPKSSGASASDCPVRFYDDNGTAALDLLQAYAQTGDRTYLDQAKEIFNFIKTGQHPDGGMMQREGGDPNWSGMSSTGSDTQVALRLYLATHDAQYLDFAQKNYQFMQTHFRATEQNPQGLPVGLYWGQRGPADGAVGPATGPNVYAGVNSYNQGFPIEIEVLLFKITDDKQYLADAGRTAALALAYWNPERLWADAPSFNAIFFRNLLALDQVAPNPLYRQALDSYLEAVWTRGRDPKTGLFDQGAIGHYGPAGNYLYLDQAALVQLFALAQWPPQALGMVH